MIKEVWNTVMEMCQMFFFWFSLHFIFLFFSNSFILWRSWRSFLFILFYEVHRTFQWFRLPERN